jgi:hypothetical protein
MGDQLHAEPTRPNETIAARLGFHQQTIVGVLSLSMFDRPSTTAEFFDLDKFLAFCLSAAEPTRSFARCFGLGGQTS